MKAIKAISLMAAVRLAATTTSTAVDLAGYSGEARLVLNSSNTEAADNTADVKITHCDTVAGAYVDAGVAFAQVVNGAASHQVIGLNVDKLKRFVKVVGTLAGTTPKVTLAVELIAHADQV